MIWIYCVHNQDGFVLEISHKLLEECFGMKKRAYDLAIRSLIENEFLVKKSRQHYDFIEYPEAHKTFKSANMAQLKVPDQHIQKRHNSTFKSANMAQDNNIRQDNIRYKDNTTSAQSDGQAIVLSSSTEEYQPSEAEKRIFAHMEKIGFTMLPTEHVHQYSIRQWLNDGADPEHIISAISETMQRAGDPQKAPIEDALSYLNARLAYERN